MACHVFYPAQEPMESDITKASASRVACIPVLILWFIE